MDVIRRVQRWAWSRPRVLLVDAPGARDLRWTMESELDRRGWPIAASPAETDLLVVLGTAGEGLSRAVDVLWSQVPQPRHRSSVGSGTDVGRVLDTALDGLLATATGAPLDEQTRPSPATLLGRSGDDDHAGMGHEGQAGMGHAGHGSMDHTGHTDVDHTVHAGTDPPDPDGADHTGHEHGDHREHEDADEPGHGGIEHAGHDGLGHSGVDHADPEESSHGAHADPGGHDAMQHGGHAGTDHEGHEAEDRRHEVSDDAGQPGAHHGDAEHARHTGVHRDGHAGMAHDGHAGMDHGGMDHGGMDHGGMDHGGMDHGGMDHGSMEVAGLPMADTAPDRDGLRLDALRVTLGPVLPGWPTGLLLRGQLQGDVLTDVSLSWVDAADHGDGHSGDRPSARLEALDHLARFLDVAGWPVAARDARRARDDLRAADPDLVDAGHRRAVQLARRVRRSRTLAWSVRGIGAMAEDGAQQLRGDVLDRVRWWCELAADRETTVDARSEPSLERVAQLLEGAELAAARLVVASVPLTRHVTGASVVADV